MKEGGGWLPCIQLFSKISDDEKVLKLDEIPTSTGYQKLLKWLLNLTFYHDLCQRQRHGLQATLSQLLTDSLTYI